MQAHGGSWRCDGQEIVLVRYVQILRQRKRRLGQAAVLAFSKSLVDRLHDLGRYLLCPSSSQQLRMGFLIYPSGGIPLGRALCCLVWPQRDRNPVAHNGRLIINACRGFLPFPSSFQFSILFMAPPGIISQINYLHSLTYLRICFWGNPIENTC